MDTFVVVLNDVIKLCITDVFDFAVTRRFQQKFEMKALSNTSEGLQFQPDDCVRLD
jgi:hypothetical protein